MRRAFNSGSYHVPIDGFSQVIMGPEGGVPVFVSGLTGRSADGTIFGIDDPAAQMRQIFTNLKEILASAGASLDDVMSIRTYVRDMKCWPEIEPVWTEHWGKTWPASTLVEVSGLFDDRQLVELEATAMVPSASGSRR